MRPLLDREASDIVFGEIGFRGSSIKLLIAVMEEDGRAANANRDDTMADESPN